MSARTEFQIIVGADGKPAFVVVPYAQFRRMRGGFTHGTVPNEVVNLAYERGMSPMAACGNTSTSPKPRLRLAQESRRLPTPRWSVSGNHARLRF